MCYGVLWGWTRFMGVSRFFKNGRERALPTYKCFPSSYNHNTSTLSLSRLVRLGFLSASHIKDAGEKSPAFVQMLRLRAACLAPLTSPRRVGFSVLRWVHSGLPESPREPARNRPSHQVPAPPVAQTAALRLLPGSLRSPWSTPPVPRARINARPESSPCSYVQRAQWRRRPSVSRSISDHLFSWGYFPSLCWLAISLDSPCFSVSRISAAAHHCYHSFPWGGSLFYYCSVTEDDFRWILQTKAPVHE